MILANHRYSPFFIHITYKPSSGIYRKIFSRRVIDNFAEPLARHPSRSLRSLSFEPYKSPYASSLIFQNPLSYFFLYLEGFAKPTL